MEIIKKLFTVILLALIFSPAIAEENVLHIGLLKWGSVNWEIDIIEHNELDKKKSYFVYCRSGKRSYSACEIMKELGFTNLYNLESGYLDWVECNYETVR